MTSEWLRRCSLALVLLACTEKEDAPGGSAGTPSNAGSSGSAGSGTGGKGGSSGGTAGTAGKGGTGGANTAGTTTGGSGGAVGGSGGSSGGVDGGDAGESAAGTSGGGTGGVPPVAPAGCETPRFDPADFATVHEVGPRLDFETPSDVPWEALEPGTLVRIHARAEPYRDKWVVNAAGTEEAPIVVLGVPEGGVLPVISGEDATTRSELDYWNEPRGIVKVGGANIGDGAAYITIACLDIQSGKPGFSFSDAGGGTVEYAENAACVYLEEGSHITVEQNLIHGCGNGIFVTSTSSDVVVSGNYVYDNGNAGSIYEHNSYTEATRITFEFNRYGALCDGCEGNNLKDRSAGTVIRYNWIEGGNRQLDLVESDHQELIDDPSYRETHVYGNVLVEPDGAGNSQIVHYGGDSGDESLYRKGTLFFHYNTVVSTRSGNTTLFRLSSEEERVDARNNVFSVSADPSTLAISAGMGTIELSGNWLPAGWVDTHDSLTGSIADNGNVEGAEPGFVDDAQQDFSLASGSACVGAAVTLAAEADAPELQYEKHQAGTVRTSADDLGAFEGAN